MFLTLIPSRTSSHWAWLDIAFGWEGLEAVWASRFCCTRFRTTYSRSGAGWDAKQALKIRRRRMVWSIKGDENLLLYIRKGIDSDQNITELFHFHLLMVLLSRDIPLKLGIWYPKKVNGPWSRKICLQKKFCRGHFSEQLFLKNTTSENFIFTEKNGKKRL